MGKRPIIITENWGGQAPDLKQGPANSFAYSRHIDFRKYPTMLSILPETGKESSTTVTGLITELIRLPSGKLVGVDSSGGVYTRATNGTWAKNGTTLPNTAYGMVYNLQHDTIYVPGTYTVHSITNADGRFGGSFTVNSNTLTAQVDQSATDSTNSYTTLGSISEADANKLTVTPTIEPHYSIKLWVKTKGTGPLTVTMHDAANNTLGSTTVLSANITSDALNEFVVTTPVRMNVRPNASQYHFHVTHPSGTASPIGVATSGELSTARFETYSHRLVSPTNGFHPAYEFLQFILILNERYVAAWEPISQSAPSANEFLQHRLIFPSGYEATSGAIWTEYFMVGTEKRSASSTNEFQEGKIFGWDGISTSYNFIIDVPEGAPYSLFSQGNVLYYFAGGGWYAWSGGNPVKIFQLPNTDSEYKDESLSLVNYPHTQAVRNGILVGGFPSQTSSTSIEHGVYSFGNRNVNYSKSFGFSYTISTGSRTNGTLRIGVVKAFGDQMFISWRDDSTYGVDIVSPNSDPFSTAVWESLIYDGGRPDKDKSITEVKLTFKALPTGATITPKYKINRGDWVTGTAATEGATECILNVNNRFKEIQIGFDAVATTTTPEIISASLLVEDLGSESD